MIHVPKFSIDLGDLADSRHFTQAADVTGQDVAKLKKQLKQMLLIRLAEEKIADKIKDGSIVCPCHLAIGQEAIPVSLASFLRSSDRVFGTHRSHGHFLAMNDNVESLFAEVLGRSTGCSKGMGGSMHLYDDANGFKGSVPIVAGTISLAVGAALAAKLQGKAGNYDVGVAYFGDGAAEEGSLHESLNYAAQFKLPMIFVCENNFFSSHLHIALRQPSQLVARYASAHLVRSEVVDGNNIPELNKTLEALVDYCRKGEGPVFIEAITYRWRGHVGPSEDEDVGLKRKDDLLDWKRRDPVRRLVDGMVSSNMLSDSDYKKILGETQDLISSAWAAAEKAPYPEASLLMNTVYKGK